MNKINNKKQKRPVIIRRVAKYIRRKVIFIFFAVLCIFIFLFGYIIYLQRHNGNDYNKKILSNAVMSYESKTIKAERGLIFDRNGTSVAYNENQYTLIIEPANIVEFKENIDPTVNALSKCYGFDADELKTIINKNKKSYYYVLKKELKESERKKFLDYKEKWTKEANDKAEAEAVVETQEATSVFGKIKNVITGNETKKVKKNPGKIIGVYFEKNYKRVYPYNTIASTTIGFSNNQGGVTGIESYYNKILSGTDGRKYGYLNQNSAVGTEIVEAKNGQNVVMTIDMYVQKICQNLINNYEKKTGSNVSALMVMNPKNGEIYAMASSNPYDLNNPTDLSYKYTDKQIAKMSEKEKSEALLLKWRNFCTSSSYEPGSTAKLFTIAAALEENCIQKTDTFFCDGVGVYGGCKIHCWKVNGHGPLDVTGALKMSCNDALMQIGMKLGSDLFCEYQKKFNIGSLTGIDLPDELSCENQIYNKDNMTVVDLVTNSFGQNYYVTMVQMCAAYASIVNGGYYYEPHVVKQILNSDGSVVENIEPKLVRQTVSKDTSEFLNKALYEVVETGTAGRVKIDGYEIGAKTGTAEKFTKGSRDEKYTVSLMAVVPTSDPEVIVYAVVDEPHVKKSENTYQAKDLCKAAMEKILPYLNIYPTSDNDDSDNDKDSTMKNENEMYEDSMMEAGNAENIRRQALKAAESKPDNSNTSN